MVEAAFTNSGVDQIDTQIRLRGFGYHSQDALIALATLSVGRLCPSYRAGDTTHRMRQ
jgi:hypothetical protein